MQNATLPRHGLVKSVVAAAFAVMTFLGIQTAAYADNTVDGLAAAIAAATTQAEIDAALANAGNLTPQQIAEAFGKAYAAAEAAEQANTDTILAAYDSFVASSDVDPTVLASAFQTGYGPKPAPRGQASVGGYQGSSTSTTTTNDNTSAN